MHVNFNTHSAMKRVIILILLLFLNIFSCFSQRPDCISTYQELKASLRSNRTDNVQKMLDVFYPPNLSTNHVVFVNFCVREDFRSDPETGEYEEMCNHTFSKYQFQWLSNSLPLLIDSDVFRANTFDFARLRHINLSLAVDPFCDDADGFNMLLTLTVWLKSYALGDEDTIEAYCTLIGSDNETHTIDGYVQLFQSVNRTEMFRNDRLLQNAKKFVIGLWLGTTSLTFALILHVGRCSIKTANVMNKVLWDITSLTNKIVSLPKKFVAFVKTATQKMETDNKEVEASKSLDELRQTVEHTFAKSLNDGEQSGIKEPTDVRDEEPITHHINFGSVPEAETSFGQNVLQEVSEVRRQTNIPIPSSKVLTSLAMGKPPKNVEGEEQDVDLDHAFSYFAKSIRKISTTSIILVLLFLGYDIYAYITHARKLSFDWLVLFPFPFWFGVTSVINLFAFIITEVVLFCRKKKNKNKNEKNQIMCVKIYKFCLSFVTTMSATTLPLFLFFHVFWLTIGSSSFLIRIASSAAFYIPLTIFLIWLLSITSSMLRRWKHLILKEISKKNEKVTCKRVLRFLKHFLYPLIPYLFLPFWVLLLATLHFFRDFLLNVVDIQNTSIIVVITIIFGVIGSTVRIAKDCQPKLEDDEPEENE